jgi:hypothetical protein
VWGAITNSVYFGGGREAPAAIAGGMGEAAILGIKDSASSPSLQSLRLPFP